VKRPDFDREDNTVSESVEDVQRALDEDDELGGPTVLSSPDALDLPTPQPRQAPPSRATPMPPVRPTPSIAAPAHVPTRPSTSIMTSAPVRPPAVVTPPPAMTPQPVTSPRLTPPYGVPARGTPAAMPMHSPFEQSSMRYDESSFADAGSFEQSFTEDDAQTQLASASYDDQVAKSLYAHTPRPGSQQHIQQQQYLAQQHAPYEPPDAFQPPMRPSMQRMSQPQMADNPEMQARLARLQGLSLERPAVAPSSSSSRGGSSKLPWILLAIVVVGGGAYHFYTVSKTEKSDSKVAAAAPSQTSTGAGPSMSASSLLASGYINAKAPITMSATAAGRLKDVTVDAGDTITKGQLLAALDEGDIRAELGLASARVRAAKRQRARVAMLLKAQAATQSDLERAQSELEVANGEYGIVSQKLDKTKIKSPINGTVLEVLAHPGESLSPGPSGTAAVLRIADLSELIAEVDVAEAELKNVYIGQDAEVTSEAQRGHTYKGLVREISEQADRARGTVLVKVDIEGELPDGTAPAPTDGSGSAAPPKEAPKNTGLKPGMAVQVRFIARKT
jgi:multidrug efflux pump subunit AcrA (membrane-fusion protein)